MLASDTEVVLDDRVYGNLVDDDDAEHFYALRLELAKSPVSSVPAFLAQHPAAMAST